MTRVEIAYAGNPVHRGPGPRASGIAAFTSPPAFFPDVILDFRDHAESTSPTTAFARWTNTSALQSIAFPLWIVNLAGLVHDGRTHLCAASQGCGKTCVKQLLLSTLEI
jgi:hypothetical protein